MNLTKPNRVVEVIGDEEGSPPFRSAGRVKRETRGVDQSCFRGFFTPVRPVEVLLCRDFVIMSNHDYDMDPANKNFAKIL